MTLKEWLLLVSIPFTIVLYPIIWLIAKLILCSLNVHIPGWEFKTSYFDRNTDEWITTQHIKACAFCEHETDLLK